MFFYLLFAKQNEFFVVCMLISSRLIRFHMLLKIGSTNLTDCFLSWLFQLKNSVRILRWEQRERKAKIKQNN